jgi:DNA helicase TIP49 (TBP-interacting protein)
MSSPVPPRMPPRFLPTLTEVVRLPVAPVAAAVPTLDADDMIDRIMLRLDGPLQAALQSAIASLVVEKLREMEPRIRDEVDRAVRATVEEAIVQEIAAHMAAPQRVRSLP